MKYTSRNTSRLEALRREGGANAIDYLEVSHATAATPALRQRTLVVQLLTPLSEAAPAPLRPSDVVIDGGDRFPTVRIEWVARGDALPAGESPAPLSEFDDPSTLLVVRTSAEDPSGGRGDHSDYTFRLADPARWNLDPRLSSIRFQFKVECPSPFDCPCDCFCSPDDHGEAPAAPVIDYLAKDYSSFRRALLDRMTMLLPGWTERHAADLGVVVPELVAYVTDALSYQQDAIATEALFPIARDRIALRRHARLLDYRPDEGHNARVYVRFSMAPGAAPIELPAGLPLFTGGAEAPTLVRDRSTQARLLAESDTVIFETMQPAVVSGDLDTFDFWSYGEPEPVLAAGATSASLAGHHPQLRVGDVILLSETRDPSSGEENDADPTRRQIVRLTRVTSTVDAVGSLFDDPGPVAPAAPVPVTEIEWHPEDALRRPLCLTANEGKQVAAQAFGNLVLADHGRTMAWRPLPDVPPVTLTWPAECGDDQNDIAPRYRPVLPTTSLIHALPLHTTVLADSAEQMAPLTALRTGNAALVQDWLARYGVRFGGAIVDIRGREGAWSVDDGERTILVDRIDGRLRVTEAPTSIAAELNTAGSEIGPAVPSAVVTHNARDWLPVSDLLGSGPDERSFVAEIDSTGRARLRFGDQRHGLPLDPGSTGITARFRDGGRTLGNIGYGTIRTIDAFAVSKSLATALKAVGAVTNPLPAQGGTAPETEETIRRSVPYAFREQRRAVTMADYAARAATTPGPNGPAVQRAEATSRWTGSWYTTYLAIDPITGSRAGAELAERIAEHVESYRMAGVDLDIDTAVYVPLLIELDIIVDSGALAMNIQRRALDRLGLRGYFHPDRFTFGQDVLLSPLVATVTAVEGVRAVTVRRFERAEGDVRSRIAEGVIPIARLEIPQCDNDPDFPDRGRLTVNVRGGR